MRSKIEGASCLPSVAQAFQWIFSTSPSANALALSQNWDKSLIKGQNLMVFDQEMRCGHLVIGRNYHMTAKETRILWERLDEFDEFPWDGTIVVIAHDKDPLRWAYLPIDATRQDVESAFSRGYCWYGPAVCQATKMARGKIIEQWSFTIEPFVHELA
jgi:hypothetical protein